MRSFIDFFINVGRLRGLPRRGGVLIGAKNPATVTDHSFRVALMCLILGREKKYLNLKRVLEMSLIHDLCELHTGDWSPYDIDSILPKNKKEWPTLFDKWPRFSLAEKRKMSKAKHRRESEALTRLVKGLSPSARREVKNVWEEYEKNLSREAKFVKQVNRLETLLQALEYGRDQKIRVYNSWWTGTRERIDDPILVKFMNALEKEFSPKRK